MTDSTKNVYFPVGRIMDDQGYFSLEWQQWLQNPQFLSLIIGAPIDVLYGGTGASTFTDHGVVLGHGINPLTAIALTNGQLIVGQTGADPQAKTITGDITIAASGAVTLQTTTNTFEIAQDAVGTILTDTSTIDLTYNDGVPSITAAVVAGSIGPTQLADTAVTPGSYTNTNLTVDADGRITAASSGGSGVGVTFGDILNVPSLTVFA